MKPTRIPPVVLCLLAPIAFAAPPPAVPATLQHQGKIAMDGAAYSGTGNFKFALYHGTAPGTVSTPLWKNDDAGPGNAGEPAAAVTATVQNGLYSILLGEAPQAALPADLKPPAGEDLYLRIWFSDGVNYGFQQLAPDRPIAAVAFARHANLAGESISQLSNDANYLSATGGGTINGDLTITGTLDAGDNSSATGNNSVAFGHDTLASGLNALAWGFESEASDISSTAWGSGTIASGRRSTAWGLGSVSSGVSSTSWGENTVARSFVETALGQYNTDYSADSPTGWDADDRLLVIGNGTSSGARSDALVMRKSGDTELNGELCVNDDVVAAGDFRYKSATTGRVHVQALDFVAGLGTSMNHRVISGVRGAVKFSGSSSVHRYGAPVDLPAGATVTGLVLYLYEDSVDGEGKFTSIDCELHKRTLPGGGISSTVVCDIDLNDGPPFDGLPLTVSTTTVNSGLVGAGDQFFISAEFNVNNTLDIGILGARVNYTTTAVTP